MEETHSEHEQDELRAGKKTRSMTKASNRGGTRRGREQEDAGEQPAKRNTRRPAPRQEQFIDDDVEPMEEAPRLLPKKKKANRLSMSAAAGADDVNESDGVMNSVVKVFCTHTEFNFSLPWQRKRQYGSSSSGFIISGRRILTNAHSVDHHTQVLAVGMECDIAMLTVQDDEFWGNLEPVVFEGLPRLQDQVTVVGFPIGGDTLSVSSGVVSRIETTSYVHGASELLGIQIDAAINSGNSGGPAFNDKGACIGIAFQSLKAEEAELIGYIIPVPVINHFITDYERNGKYTGFPQLGIEWQKMENSTLRAALGMQPNQSGVLVRRVEPTCPSSKHLKEYDILMSFDGISIANDGSVMFRSGERISFSYLTSQKYTLDTAKLEVLSQGQLKTVTLQLSPPHRLVPFHIDGRPPSYFIIGGLVFTSVTVPYLKSTYGRDYDLESPVILLDKMQNAMAQKPHEQVVVLSQVLAAEINVGYEDICNSQVAKLNGKPISNLKELVTAVDACKDGNLHFDLDFNSKVILPVEGAKAATKEILETHCIPSDRSLDLV